MSGKKTKVRHHKMSPQECHDCIVQDKVIDLNNDEYIRRELDGKLVFFHDICYKTWKEKH